MTSVLFWNLQTFGINKINDPSLKRSREGGRHIGGNTPQAASHMRRTLVDNILAAANADIIVIVEAASGDSYPNDLATFTGGMEGAIYLLNRLRGVANPDGWRLVPPLRVGRRPGSKPETVLVLFKGNTAAGQRYFTGPDRWSGGVNGNSRPAPALGNAYGAGPPDLDGMLVPPVPAPAPPARVIPATALYNAGLAENVVSARVQFEMDGAPGYQVDYGVFRPPYMATFSETNAMGVVTRNITLFGVHSPATAGDPNVFITYLTQTADVVSGLGANETRVIGGDFNLNLMTPTGAASGVYAPLANYTPLLQSPGAPAPANLSAFMGYFATHLKPAPTGSPTENSLFLWSDGVTNSPYPGYGYIGSDMVANFYSIDNILVWPHQGPPYNYQTSIINPISGSPFNQVLPTPGGGPQGTVVLANQMLRCLQAWPQAPTAPRLNVGNRKNMIAWDNYGYQKSTSDHFGVYAVV